jgi:two-component system, sensor histidine kinase and response regulator
MDDQMRSRVKCLLVDDLEENLLALSALLADDSVDLLLARSGPDALELLLVHDVALAFLDVQMPDMDGFELAELMRGSDRTRHIPLIFITAGTRDQHRVFEGYEAGAVDFIYKPIEPHILKNKAAVFFQLYRQKQQLAHDLRERTETLRLNEMFTAVLGHDLRNPLSVILAAAELVGRRATDDALKRNAERIVSSGKWMGRMIDDILDLARARLAGGIPLSRQQCDLATVIQRVVQDHQAAHAEREITLGIDGDVVGSWDPDRLAQAASNLIGNAVQHGADQTPIDVVVDGTAQNAVTLTVANAGTIPAALLAHVFEPFRSGQSQSGKGDGLGLGLYIVQQIAKAHRGVIAVDASEPGRTMFRMTVPRWTSTGRDDAASPVADTIGARRPF